MTQDQEAERLARVNERIAMLAETRRDTVAAGYPPDLAVQWVGTIDVMAAALTKLRDVLRFNAGYDCDSIPKPCAHDGIIEEPDIEKRLASMRRNGSTRQNLDYERARLAWMSGQRKTKPTPEEFGAVDYAMLRDIPRLDRTPL